MAHALGRAVLHCCCTSFSKSKCCYPPFSTHPLSPMNTDLSTLFSFIALVLGFASWIYRWLSLACFYYIWGLLPWNCSWCTTSFWHILHTKFSTKYGKVFVYDFVVVIILCCNRMKFRTSLFFNKKNCWHPKERERTWHNCCSHHQMICVWIWNVERKQVKWFGWEGREGMVLKGHEMEWNKMSDT